MALSVDYIYDFARKLIRVNQAGSLSSLVFAKHWNDAQGTYQDDLVGRFQTRANGKLGINTGLIENRTILQKLAPFTKTVPLAISSGEASRPSDFIYELALRINGEEVRSINHNQIATVNKNVIDPPSEANDAYYVVIYEGYYKFLPSSVTEAELDYICTPTDVFWNYTIDGSGRQVYTATDSVQPQWDNNSCREITKRMLTNLGVSYKDADFASFGKSVQLTGE